MNRRGLEIQPAMLIKVNMLTVILMTEIRYRLKTKELWRNGKIGTSTYLIDN